jgi:hypothetical protein
MAAQQQPLVFELTVDLPNVSAGETLLQNFTVTGLRVGDLCQVVPAAQLVADGSAAFSLYATRVTAPNTLPVVLVNGGGAGANAASMKFHVVVLNRLNAQKRSQAKVLS